MRRKEEGNDAESGGVHCSIPGCESSFNGTFPGCSRLTCALAAGWSAITFTDGLRYVRPSCQRPLPSPEADGPEMSQLDLLEQLQ